ERVGSDLSPPRLDSLELLVRARGPVDPEVLRKIIASVEFGRTFAYIAGALIEREIIDGMGKGWPPSKVRRVYCRHLDEAGAAASSAARATAATTRPRSAGRPVAAIARATKARRRCSATCRVPPTVATGCASPSDAGRSRFRGTRRCWTTADGPSPTRSSCS